MTHAFETHVAAALERIGVRAEAILLGLSGGADSVALFHALLAMREQFMTRVVAAHLNHGLRGTESDRDEAFVRELCARTGVDLIVDHAEGLAGPNLEERAREKRREFLRDAAARVGASRIALAHHAGDQAETVLLRLLRGAGIAGLAAMAEAGPGEFIRPMLSVERPAILDYLGAIGASFVTDSTNESPSIFRNRIRRDLVPMLEREYTPGLACRLNELASEMQSVDDFLNAAAIRELDQSMTPDGSLDLSHLAKFEQALASAVIRAFVRNRIGSLRRFERAHIQAIRKLCTDGPPNGNVDLPGGWHAIREYNLIAIRRSDRGEPRPFEVRLDTSGRTTIPAVPFVFEAALVDRKGAVMPASLKEALFDADEIAPGLVARSFAPGDRIRPLGMSGSRKVKEVFIDNKVPRPLRLATPIVVVRDEVAWIPGLVRGRVALVTRETSRVVHLRALAER